jgi:O-antigen/teichoic acid export membrane protein
VCSSDLVVFLSLSAILRLIIVPWKPHLEINFVPLKPFFSFSVKLFLTSLFQQINTYIFSVILGKYYGKNVLGQFDRGQNWVVRGNNFIIGMINYVTQPVLAQMNENKERQVNVLRKLIRFGAFVSFPLMLGLAFVGEEFIVLTIGEKWLPSVPILQLFCISGAVGFIVTLFSNLIYTQGKSGLYMNITVIIGTIQIIAALCLLPFGIKPMLSGYIAVYLAGLFVWHHYVYKLVGLRLTAVLKDIMPYLVITLSCFAITWLLTKNMENKIALLVLKTVISGIFYIFALKISRSTIFKESMDFLLKRTK